MVDGRGGLFSNILAYTQRSYLRIEQVEESHRQGHNVISVSNGYSYLLGPQLLFKPLNCQRTQKLHRVTRIS
jgi:hypothetical protein